MKWNKIVSVLYIITRWAKLSNRKCFFSGQKMTAIEFLDPVEETCSIVMSSFLPSYSYVKFLGKAIKDCCVCVMCVCSMCDNSIAVYAIISQLTPISSKGTRIVSHPIVRECIIRIRIEFVSSHMFETTPMEPPSLVSISPICMLCLFILWSSNVHSWLVREPQRTELD